MTKLAAQTLSITYINQQTHRLILALNGVNFTVNDGQFVAIVGPSGCGKSTLLKCARAFGANDRQILITLFVAPMGGAVKSFPFSGRIYPISPADLYEPYL